MALTSNEISETKTDEVNASSSDSQGPMEHEEVEDDRRSMMDEEQQQQSSSTSLEPDDEPPLRKNLNATRRTLSKTRSVSFAPMVEEYEIPARSSFSSDCSADFLDALVESYKLQTAANLFPEREEKKYVPKTAHTRVSPNWREHRIRRLMNRLEELSLWDREEELKASQAQCLRAQKLEQIQDRQRNNDLCLQLMRQRHESEMESAVLLDQGAHRVNKESVRATIAKTISLTLPSDALDYDLPRPPYQLKRRVQQEREKPPALKTPLGRYREFENSMSHKMEKINQHFQPDWQIMRAYSPFHASIPASVVPLFSETYASLLSIPDAYASNRYSSHQSSPHAPSPDYETRLRAHSNRDVRVPLKEQSSDGSDDDDDNANNQPKHSRSSFSPPRRSTRSVSSTASSLYDCSSIYSRQSIASNIPRRSRNDDRNALTYYSYESNDRRLPARLQSSIDQTTKPRSSSIPVNKRLGFDDRGREGFTYSKSARGRYRPAIIPLSAAH